MKRKIKNILKKYIGLFYYLEHLILRRGSASLYLKGTKYISYKYLPSFSVKKYLQIKEYNEGLLINKLKEKGCIDIYFVVYSSTMWFFDELYCLLKESGSCRPAIVIGHCVMNNTESSNVEYQKTLSFFEKKNYTLVKPEEIKDYSVLFYLTPFPFYEKCINIQKLRLNQLLLHVSYSYMLSGNTEKLGFDMYHWTFRYYTDSRFYLEMLSKHIKKYSNNARYLGFPKMDSFYSSDGVNLSNKKIIIYAPHHSVNYTEFKSATFEQNYRYILSLAKKYSDSTYWIYKPHPLLRDHSVVAGIFKTYEDYDKYVNEWASLDNACVVDSGDYFSVFKSSAGMITDSVSFLAEYQFTGKPLLLLESGEEKYNEFGNRILEVLYRCSGDNFEAIDDFVNTIALGIDPMKETRELFFNENLNYIDANNQTANKKIYKDIYSSIICYGEE